MEESPGAIRRVKNEMADIRTTDYGFQFGAARVERFCSHKGYVIIGVTTPRQRFEIEVTPSGLIKPRQVVKNLSNEK